MEFYFLALKPLFLMVFRVFFLLLMINPPSSAPARQEWRMCYRSKSVIVQAFDSSNNLIHEKWQYKYLVLFAFTIEFPNYGMWCGDQHFFITISNKYYISIGLNLYAARFFVCTLILCIVMFYRSVSRLFSQINTKPWLYYSVKRKNIIPQLLILFRKCGIIVKKLRRINLCL